jgi:hypothetical protein
LSRSNFLQFLSGITQILIRDSPIVVKLQDLRKTFDLNGMQNIMGSAVDTLFFNHAFFTGGIRILQKFAEPNDVD